MFPPFPEYHESGLVVVAARPAMGKTKFLCSIANERADRHNVLIHSLEFSEKQLRNKYCEKTEPVLVIDDTPSLSFQELESCVMDVVVMHHVKTVVIDYVNLIRNIESKTVLPVLKSLAQELNIEIIVGVLVSRSRNGINDPTVTLEDIQLGGIEAIDEFIPLESQGQYCFV